MGPGWWQASDGRYYPPETAPGSPAPPGPPTPSGSPQEPDGPWSAPTFAHGPYAYGTSPPAQGTNPLAVASLVCSILGLCCPLAVVGVVLGHVALSQLARPGNTQQGRGLAIAGLAVGYSWLVLSAIFMVAGSF